MYRGNNPYAMSVGGQEPELTVTQFMLSPDIPPAERYFFDKYYLMFSKIMALGNIERRDVFGLLLAFDEICLLLDIGLYDEARKVMGREIMKMQCSRSIGGFQTLYGQQGVQRTEQINRIYSRTRQKTLGSRIANAFRKGGRTEPQWEEVPQG